MLCIKKISDVDVIIQKNEFSLQKIKNLQNNYVINAKRFYKSKNLPAKCMDNEPSQQSNILPSFFSTKIHH